MRRKLGDALQRRLGHVDRLNRCRAETEQRSSPATQTTADIYRALAGNETALDDNIELSDPHAVVRKSIQAPRVNARPLVDAIVDVLVGGTGSGIVEVTWTSLES